MPTNDELIARFATVLNEHSLSYVEDFVIVHCRCGWKSDHTDNLKARGGAHRVWHEHVGTVLMNVMHATKPWVVKQKWHDAWEVWNLDGRQAVRDPEREFEPTLFSKEKAEEMRDVMNATAP